MTRQIDRRTVTGSIGVAIAAGLAGCGGGGSEETDEGGEETSGGETTGTESGMGGMDGQQFSYTFSDSDSVVGSALTGIGVDYPDGSGAVADATVESATLGGEDVTGDLDGTSTSNDDTTLTLDFGGNVSIESGAELAMTLGNVSPPSGSYTVEVTVNPQSGATTFSREF